MNPKAQSSSLLLGISLAVLASNLFSSKVLLAKMAFAEGASPLQILALRMAVALPFFAGVAVYLLLQNSRLRPSWRDFAGMTGLGLLGYYTSSLLDFHGMVYLTSSMERLILYLYPTFLLFIRLGFEGKRPSRTEWGALTLAYVGAGLFYLDEVQQVSSRAWIGALLVSGSALCYAFYLYGSVGYIRKLGSRFYASFSSAISCVAMVLHLLLFEGVKGVPSESSILWIGLCLGLLCTVIPTFLLHYSIAVIGAVKVGMLGATGILGPFALGVVFFSEPLNLTRILGSALVVGAVLILGRER